MAADIPTIETVITHLEMREAPRLPHRPLPAGKVAFLHAEKPTISFYRYLYETVGGPWLWWERCAMSDAELAAIVHDDYVEVYVLYVNGVPAGYGELDRREMPAIELAFFGLIPDFIGHGLGPTLLQWMIEQAWTHEPDVLTVHTCTLDHPRALGLYQKLGFSPVRQETEVIDDPRAKGIVPAHFGAMSPPLAT